MKHNPSTAKSRWQTVWLCAIVCLFLLPVAVQCFRAPIRLEFSSSALTVMDEAVRSAADADELPHSTEAFALQPGAYRVAISYEATPADETQAIYDSSFAKVELTSPRHSVFCRFAPLSLRNALQKMEQTLQVTSPWQSSELYFDITRETGDALRVDSITVTEIPVYNIVCLAGRILLLAVLALLYRKLGYGSLAEKEVWGGLGLICFFGILPFLSDSTFVDGHDLQFHLNRITCMAEEIRMGRFFSPIYTTAVNGYGYAAPMFYGQVFLYLPALLFACGFSLSVALNVYLSAITIATALIMHWVAKRIFRKETLALLASALYTFSIPRLTNLMQRCAIGEVTAQVFLPLVALGFYQIYAYPLQPKTPKQKIPFTLGLPIVIGLSGVLLSHVLTTYFCAFLIVAFCLINYRKTLQWPRFWVLCKTAALLLLANLSTLIPFLDGYTMDLYVKVYTNNYIQKYGAYLQQLFDPIVRGLPRHAEVNTPSHDMTHAIGFSLVIGLVVYVAYLCLKNKDADKPRDSLCAFSKTCFGFALVSLFLCGVWVPYDALDVLPKAVYQVLTLFQFPWRWLVWVALFGVFCTVYALSHIDSVWPSGKRVSALCTGLVLAFLALNAGQFYADQINEGEVAPVPNNSHEYSMVYGSGEYLLKYNSLAGMQRRDMHFAGNVLSVSEHEQVNGVSSAYVVCGPEADGLIEFPLICYKHYRAWAEDGTPMTVAAGRHDQVRVQIPAGFEGRVFVSYPFPKRYLAAIAVSSASIVGAGAYLLIKRRKAKQA